MQKGINVPASEKHKYSRQSRDLMTTTDNGFPLYFVI